jgi:uncharacterized protein (TIGR00290 family)
MSNVLKKAVFNWSGGKDSAFALWKILNQKEYSVETLLTSVNQKFNRISMHGVRRALLEEQARLVGFPLDLVLIPEEPSMSDYDNLMAGKLTTLKNSGIDYSIYGDIFLEDLKKYREQRLNEVGMKAVFPIWKMDTREVVTQFIDLGFKAVVVSANARLLDKSFAGRVIDYDFLHDLPDEVDPCGENGEFHSFVFDGPIFNKPVDFKTGETILKEYKTSDKWDSAFWYCDLVAKT